MDPLLLGGVAACRHYSAAIGYAALRAGATHAHESGDAIAQYWLAELVRLLGLLMFATLAAESYVDTLLVAQRLRRLPVDAQPLLPIMMYTVERICEERRASASKNNDLCGLRFAFASDENCLIAYSVLVCQADLMWQGTRQREDHDQNPTLRLAAQSRLAFGEETHAKILEMLDLCKPFAENGSREWQERTLRLSRTGRLSIVITTRVVLLRSLCVCYSSSAGRSGLVKRYAELMN